MKKLTWFFLFVALFSIAETASADEASDWWGVNCQNQPAGDEYGRKTPLLYIGQAGVLAQVNKPFTVSVRGAMKKDADLSVSTENVTWGKKMCLDGVTEYGANGAVGCPVQGIAGQYAYNQDLTIHGTPRDVVVKVSDGGVLFPGDKGSPKPYCARVPLYRERVNYEYTLELDKTAFGSEESFKATVTGITWLQARSMNGLLEFTRSNAPVESCEFFARGAVCNADGVLTCGLLPDTSKVEYLCAATSLDTTGAFRYPNRDGDVTYTASLRNTQDGFDTYTFKGGSKDIILYKQGTNNNGGKTSYLGCPAGEGVDPRYPEKGCTRCPNIPTNYRNHISSCDGVTTPSEILKWREGTWSGFDANAPECPSGIKDGDACFVRSAGCQVAATTPRKKFDCVNTVGAGSVYHGRVVAADTGAPIAGVRIRPKHITAAYLGVTCPETTTDSNGDYRFTAGESKSFCLTLSGASIDYIAPEGYRNGIGGVGSEFDKLIPTMSLERIGGSSPTSTPPIPVGHLSIDDGVQTMDGNDVTFTLTNAVSGQIDACYQVISHPNVPDLNIVGDVPPCTDWAAINWTGNDQWKFNESNNTLVGIFKASNPEWNIPGLVVRSSFRQTGTNEVVTAQMSVALPAAVTSADVDEDDGGYLGCLLKDSWWKIIRNFVSCL
jgi:hypothetical protein